MKYLMKLRDIGYAGYIMSNGTTLKILDVVPSSGSRERNTPSLH